MNSRATQEAVSFIRSWLTYRARHVDIPGFSVSVLAGDTIIFSEAYGFADVEQKIPLTTDHLFHMASQTKMLTATAIMQLVSSGKLSLDEPICRYLSWLNEHTDNRICSVTVRHLLCHKGGFLRDANEGDHWLFKTPSPTKAQLKELVLQHTLVFDPGSAIKYSNIGYGLLGLLIEAVSKQSYKKYIQEKILNPSDMGQATLDYSSAISKRIPTGYSLPFRHQRHPITPRQSSRALVPATGLHATTEAMCHFAQAHFAGNSPLIADALKQEMQRSQAVANGYDEGTEFGLGYEIRTTGRRLVGHTGHVAGHVSATYFDPQGKIAVAVAANAKDASAGLIAGGILGVLNFFEETSHAKTNVHASRFAVRLYNEMSTVQIVHSGDRLIIIDPDDWNPFAWYETLEITDKDVLRIITPGSVYNNGETLQYTFAQGKLAHVRFAGFKMWPEEA